MIARGKHDSAPPPERMRNNVPTPEGSHLNLECATPPGSDSFLFSSVQFIPSGDV
jgi:hypothetical protein